MAKISHVDVWSTIECEGTSVSSVYYSTGTHRTYKHNYCQDWPKTVYDFLDKYGREKINSQYCECKGGN